MSAVFSNIDAVLFDLDGTLADSAPDLGGAVNLMRTRRGMTALPLAALRPYASHGARGLVGVGFGIKPGDAGFEALRDEFFTTYEQNLCAATRLFDDIEALFASLEARGLAWGIVTNKATRFTTPLVKRLGLDVRAGAVVSGDTTPHAKPHPAPLLHAAARLGVAPERCVYVGDDQRDIDAGRAAAMGTVAAAWGYCADTAASSWGADVTIDTPLALPGLIARR